ncbi:MAG TPA: thiol-disulfide oxidoreductase DCC family protein [Sphingobium sp.]
MSDASNDSDGPIIVFDAMCVLCSANAAFVLRHDRAGRFRLASMQGDIGTALYRQFGIDPANPETLIVVEGGLALRNSDAVLAIWTGLERPWNGLAAFRVIPRWLRDPVYRWVARHRYRLFGQRSTCWIPTAEQARRIL